MASTNREAMTAPKPSAAADLDNLKTLLLYYRNARTFVEAHLENVLTEVRRLLASASNRSCPCEWTTPCSEQCSCAHAYMSGGCRRCCKYGSDEQRRGMAERLVRLAAEPGLRMAVKRYFEASDAHGKTLDGVPVVEAGGGRDECSVCGKAAFFGLATVGYAETLCFCRPCLAKLPRIVTKLVTKVLADEEPNP